MAAGGAAGGAVAAAIIQASRAMGVIVMMEPDEFLAILDRQPSPLVVTATQSILWVTRRTYLTSYRGLAFACRPGEPLPLPPGCEVVKAKAIWLPG